MHWHGYALCKLDNEQGIFADLGMYNSKFGTDRTIAQHGMA